MNAVWILVVSGILFLLAYRFYGTFIAERIFKASASNLVPSSILRDDIDYVPTRKEVLFGHHFASIAGTGPIVGPAIAVLWGWLPALIWVVLGAIFAGAVHDFGALIISVRNRGISIGDLSKEYISPRVHTLFLLAILFALWIVVAIFGMVMGIIFQMYPASVFPVWIQIPIAMTVGWLVYRKNSGIMLLSVAAVTLMYLSIILGVFMPLRMPALFGMDPMMIWIILLFVYCFFASVLPVWTLLQPRDYINSHQLIIGIGLLVLGAIFSHPPVVAPLIQTAPSGAPPMLPFIFITVACGAISGFHALVSSGTSSKQLRCESEAKFIGYGGMLVEAFLAVMVIIAVSAGIGIHAKNAAGEILTGAAAWKHYYAGWSSMEGLTANVTAFVDGASNMLEALGIPVKFGSAIIGVLVASFAGTTLDTATRIQRYVLGELAVHYKIKTLQHRYPATAFVVILAALLAFSQGASGKGALVLWPIFGTSNQLLAGLTLLVMISYLMKAKINIWPVLVPMIFMVVMSSWAMVTNVIQYFGEARWHLVAIGVVMLVLEAWMIYEMALKFRDTRACSSVG